MNEENKLPTEQDTLQQNDGFFVGVRFSSTGKSYFFETNDARLSVGAAVIVETIRGYEIGFVAAPPLPLSKYKSRLELKPIVRMATKQDINDFERNVKDAADALKFCALEIERLGLKMNLVSSEFTLDRSKLVFAYISEERVDFRELLRILASKFHTRIDLRQIGSRDKAKMIGGLGICGLPLCCSTFLAEFNNISINRAKNQLLTLNIPKLSGHCSKLICCLKFEDDAYTELRATFPRIGSKVTFNNDTYRIASLNVLTRIIKLESYSDVQFMPLEEVNKLPKVASEVPAKPNETK